MPILRRVMIVAVCSSATALANSANGEATTLFEGRQVQVGLHYPSFGQELRSATMVVSDAVEFPQNTIGPYVNIDFSDTNIRFAWAVRSSFLPAQFSGYWIHDATGTIPDFRGIAIDLVSNIVGMNESRITFDADNIMVNMQGLPFTPQSILQVHVTAVPEPTALAMIPLSLLLVRRKRRYHPLRAFTNNS